MLLKRIFLKKQNDIVSLEFDVISYQEAYCCEKILKATILNLYTNKQKNYLQNEHQLTKKYPNLQTKMQ